MMYSCVELYVSNFLCQVRNFVALCASKEIEDSNRRKLDRELQKQFPPAQRTQHCWIMLNHSWY